MVATKINTPEWQNFNVFNGLLSVHMVNIKIILGVN